MSGAVGRSSRFAPPCARLRDFHLHLYQFGRSLEMVDLSACGSAGEMLDLARSACVSRRPGAVVIADKARPEGWDPPGWPALADLDRAVGGVAFCAWCFDYHSLLASTAAMRLGGVDGGCVDPSGGIIGRDRDGRASGVFYESAAVMLWEGLPDADRGRADEVLRSAVEGLRRHGIQSADDLKSQSWLGPTLARLSDAGWLDGFGVRLWPLMEDLEAACATREQWEREGVRLGGGKIFVDGTLNSRTAWVLEPYADAVTAGRPGLARGLAMMTPGEIEDAVRRCDALGVPLAAHAIGDAAVRAVLDAVERVRPRTPGFRIEHAELVDSADVGRFAELGVVCSVQPSHLLYDGEALRRGVPDRLDRVLPLRSLISEGCRPGELLVFGSDAPIVRPDPGDSVQAAVERRRAGAGAGEGIGAGEAVLEAEAWACYGVCP